MRKTLKKQYSYPILLKQQSLMNIRIERANPDYSPEGPQRVKEIQNSFFYIGRIVFYPQGMIWKYKTVSSKLKAGIL